MKLYLRTKDYSVSGEDFELQHYKERDMLITYPRPESLEPYYESGTYISHTDAAQTLADKMYQAVKRYSLSRKERLISLYANSNKTLLDVGAGTGDFLRKAQNRGWHISGVEPNGRARKRALEKNIKLLPALEALKGKKYQVITLWHVLEHVSDLENQILKLNWHLEDAGALIIAVPNFKAYDAQYYKEFWAAYDVPRHLWHFSRTAIKKIFEPHGLKIVQVKPMIFDAFYVSLLSEKYMTGKNNYRRAFLTGLRSNIKAWRSKEYSSHIYVLQKA